mmetsp:Transcript_29052/g.54827  ORF Transcript_29052/g.54827 Transcript_29052/m.54827 type:complete len:1069 (-) Transcript_29052:93-3299(-)|eukprot:CAMPEP_0182517718 /NCGR_PEP_ID=MMETSP1321-20130603/42793_1 /TAXON_ID=91990 /ORGANISM="Bolidomonas sp., Strain RCC1657" /LENGTH=1068 /DNA_ID=CAMNT_0024725483 /DNA_START=117 /DNA_END=3323 /DNA_ORIENTATION=-
MKFALLSLLLPVFGSSSKASNDNALPTLNVHIVPHTHDDVGWLKTVDQYFYGANNTIQHANVQMILSTLIPALEYDPSRKFTYVEQAFFTRWWNEQNDKMQSRVKKLVKSGQLAFVNGGWCMHDEAATHFMGMIDQTTLGHTFLQETFDYQPTVGWQIDPFGHSATQASLLSADAGFDALYFGRIDYQDLNLRREERRVEGLWRASANQQEQSQVFWGLTGSYGGNYGPPEGFCFDANMCSDQPMMDDPSLEDYNVPEQVANFVSASWDQANEARGTHIMMTMGSDFQYENSEAWFRNLDSVIKNVNEYAKKGLIEADPNARFGDIKVFYSNPEQYTRSKHKDNGDLKWEVKTDDFFPYSDCEQCFWTGYFTSRAELKKWERVGSSFLQTARQFEALDSQTGAKAGSTFDSPNHKLDAAVGVVQHHDGVSGTAKQHVAFDYAKRIDVGFKAAASYVSDVLKRVMASNGNVAPLEFSVCQDLNVSTCDVSQSVDFSQDELVVGVYNSLSHTRSEVVKVPLQEQAAYVVSTKDGEVESTLVANTDLMSDDAAPYTLFFNAEGVHAMGTKFFKIAKGEHKILEDVAAPKAATSRKLRGMGLSLSSGIKVDAGDYEVEFDDSGVLKSIAGLPVAQSWGYYTSFDADRSDVLASPQEVGDYLAWTPGVPGTCLPGYLDMEGDESRWLRDSEGQNSGAYIFRPTLKNEPLSVLKPNAKVTTVTQTDLVTEVHAEFGDWVKQTTRIVKDADYIEIEWTVGPVPTDDGIGKEVITRFDSDIQSGETFFTDSNGREFLERQLNYRPTWDMEVFQPIAGNYYPVNAAIYVEDDEHSLTVLNDRTQGGASLKPGQVELMVQRRLVNDDSRGVGEPLDETTGGVTPYPPYGEAERVGDGVIIKGTHRIVVGKGRQGAKKARENMEQMFSPLVPLFATKAASDDDESIHGFSALGGEELPEQVSLITLTKVAAEPGTFMIRLAHQYGKGEDEKLSEPASVDLAKMMPFGINVKKFAETTLTGNQLRSDWDAKKLQWNGIEQGVTQTGRDFDDGTKITLMPMEIRTFKIVTDSTVGWTVEKK